MARLLNSLADVVVILGLDEHTGIFISQADDVELNDTSDNIIFQNLLQAQVLCAVSSRVAVYPCRKDGTQDTGYPPRVVVLERHASLWSLPEESSSSEDFAAQPVYSKPRPSVSIRTGSRLSLIDPRSSSVSNIRKTSVTLDCHKQPPDSTRGSAIVTSKSPDMPMSREDMDSLCRLCFHDGMRAYSQPPSDTVRGFVMTDIAGARRYSAMLTFYRKFHARRRDVVKILGSDSPSHGVHFDLVPEHAPKGEAAGVVCYVPVCCTLVSKYAYHTVLQDALSTLYVEIKNDLPSFDRLVKNFAHRLTNVPVPPPGVVDLALSFSGSNLVIQAPRHSALPVVDLPLRLLFNSLSPARVCEALAYLLTEQRLVFTASNPALPLLVIESLLALIVPFVWVAPYVPLLSVDMIECVEAPGYFIMGLDAKHSDAVKEVEGLVVIDLDRDSIRVHSDVARVTLPLSASASFCERILSIPMNFDVHCVGRVVENLHAERRKFQEKTNISILDAANLMMVDLFKEVLQHLRQAFFDRQEFLNSLPEDDLPFYRIALQTSMFSNFLKQRVAMAANNRRDPWQIEADKQSSLIARRSSMRIPSDEVDAFRTEHVVFQLPALRYSDIEEFYADAILNLKSFSDISKDKRVNVCCLCLSGLLKIAARRPVEGLNDLSKVFDRDGQLFPKSLIEELLLSLEEADANVVVSQLSCHQFYSDLLEKARERRSSTADAFIKVELDKIPSRYVDCAEFVKYFERLDLAADRDTARRLFGALTLGGITDQVSPEAFKEFYGFWKDNELQRKEFERVLTDKLHANDRVLKVSPLVRTDYGNGRVILTERRISFLGEASNQAKEIVPIERIEKLEKAYKKTFLSGETATLRIIPRKGEDGGNASDVKSFTAALKGDRNEWYVLIKEMWYGKNRSKDLKDPFIAQHAAQNVLLLDALIRSAESESLTHARDLEKAVQLLSLYGARSDPTPLIVGPLARDTLMYRVNPNVDENVVSAVECLLFVAGDISSSETSGNAEWNGRRHTLWCGLANGKIRLFDATNWKLGRNYIQAEDRVVCMTAANGRVWAGSFDHNIYVIESTTRKLQYHCLREHDDYVTDIVAASGGGYVYSASINGRIIKFNAVEESVVSTVRLQTSSLIGLIIDNEEIWCNTKDRIVRVSSAGEVLVVLQYIDEEQMLVAFDTFLVTDRDVWAGCAHHGRLVVWSRTSAERRAVLPLDCRGVSRMTSIQGSVWAGCKADVCTGGVPPSAGDAYRQLESKLYVLNSDHYGVGHMFDAHFDTIRSACTANDKYVVTGSGSSDGRIAIWCYQPDLAVTKMDDVADMLLDASMS